MGDISHISLVSQPPMRYRYYPIIHFTDVAVEALRTNTLRSYSPYLDGKFPFQSFWFVTHAAYRQVNTPNTEE